jgi:outer membrane protein assembly factor BamB
VCEFTDRHDGGFGGPAVSNGVLDILDHEGTQDIVKALDLANGQEKWRYGYDEAVDKGANYCVVGCLIERNLKALACSRLK